MRNCIVCDNPSILVKSFQNSDHSWTEFSFCSLPCTIKYRNEPPIKGVEANLPNVGYLARKRRLQLKQIEKSPLQ